MSKPLTKSSTFQGAATAGIASLLVAISPFVFSIAKRYTDGNTKDTLADVEQIVYVILGFAGLGGSGVAIAGRVKADEPVYTPQFLPGPNLGDYRSPFKD